MQKLSIICKQIGKSIFFAMKHMSLQNIRLGIVSECAVVLLSWGLVCKKMVCAFMKQKGIPESIYLYLQLCLFTFYWVSVGYGVALDCWERSGKSALNWSNFLSYRSCILQNYIINESKLVCSSELKPSSKHCLNVCVCIYVCVYLSIYLSIYLKGKKLLPWS